jgi:hypothetical protein
MTATLPTLSFAALLLLSAAPAAVASPRVPDLPGPYAALSPVPAQYCEGECEYYDNYYDYDDPQGDDRDFPALTDGGATTIEERIADRIAQCERYEEIWRIDCLADGFQELARSLPKTGDYALLNRKLTETAIALNAIARANADPAVAPERKAVSTPAGPRTTSRPIVAVAPARLPAANAAAIAAVDELSTTLLRSATGPVTQATVARVAAAVDSTKVLLRSS